MSQHQTTGRDTKPASTATKQPAIRSTASGTLFIRPADIVRNAQVRDVIQQIETVRKQEEGKHKGM